MKIGISQILTTLINICVLGNFAYAKSQPALIDTIQSVKIWDAAPHNGFPDLIYFKNKFYCAFRESNAHIGVNGTIRLLSSVDGKLWKSMALLKKAGIDLRDPKFSVKSDGTLMLVMGGSIYKNNILTGRYPQVSFLDQKKGNMFSAPENIILKKSFSNNYDWIWRVTWYNGTGYGMDYQVKEGAKWPGDYYLLKTKDGIHYELVSKPKISGDPNETTIRFDKNGQLYALVRRENGNKMGMICSSFPPYKSWKYKELDIRLGGPNFLFRSDTSLIISTRYFENSKVRTALLLTNLQGTIKKTWIFPSGGDTGYAGMVRAKDQLWIAYYSSHEGKTSIYLASIPFRVL